jgi:hypothetical protein
MWPSARLLFPPCINSPTDDFSWGHRGQISQLVVSGQGASPGYRSGLRLDCNILTVFAELSIPRVLNSCFFIVIADCPSPLPRISPETTSLSGIFVRRAGQSSETWTRCPTARDSLVVNSSSLLEICRVSPSPEQIGGVRAEKFSLSRRG